jgi:hypothetical protein
MQLFPGLSRLELETWHACGWMDWNYVFLAWENTIESFRKALSRSFHLFPALSSFSHLFPGLSTSFQLSAFGFGV